MQAQVADSVQWCSFKRDSLRLEEACLIPFHRQRTADVEANAVAGAFVGIAEVIGEGEFRFPRALHAQSIPTQGREVPYDVRADATVSPVALRRPKRLKG